MHGHDVLPELPRRRSGGGPEVWPPVQVVLEDPPLGLPDRCDCGGSAPAGHHFLRRFCILIDMRMNRRRSPLFLVPIALAIALPLPRQAARGTAGSTPRRP